MGEVTDGERVNYAAINSGDFTSGLGAMYGAALTNQDPASQMMEREEEEALGEEWEDAQARFGFLRDLVGLALRPETVAEPARVNWFLWTMVALYYPSLIKGVSPEDQLAQRSMRARMRVNREELEVLVGGDGSERRAHFRLFLEEVLFNELPARDYLMPTKKLYATCKVYFPERIEGMSLHALGVMFEPERNPERARARWSARLQTWILKRVETAGFSAHATYQKRAASKAAYSAAQMGNNNRVKNRSGGRG